LSTTLIQELGFEQYENDPCLLKQKTAKGFVYLIIYVDDCLIIGEEDEVKEMLQKIQEHFDIKHSPDIEDFIGCTITKHQKAITLHQPDLIKKLLKYFQDELADVKEYDTPACTGGRVTKVIENALDPDKQHKFRSGVGSLLYLLKHSRPELSNAVRELSKVMDKANLAHWKMLIRVIKYVELTRNRKLILKPNEDKKWEIQAYSDSDFAGDSDNRRSISGYIIFFSGVPISWKSKGQKSVTLSSTEAEYMAMSETAMEILYIAGLLTFMEIQVEYPIRVHVDNVGAIYLAEQATSSIRTKHIDTRYHFVREYIEDGIIKITFVRSAENTADIFTKNLSKETFDKHTTRIGFTDLQDLPHDGTPTTENRKGVKK
jgi:hypothetical protein